MIAQAPGSSAANYATDAPITSPQRKMRLAHIASYAHEDTAHNLDHLKQGLGSLKKGKTKAAVYDLTHALPHAESAHMKTGKMVEQTHAKQKFATGREVLARMKERSNETK